MSLNSPPACNSNNLFHPWMEREMIQFLVFLKYISFFLDCSYHSFYEKNRNSPLKVLVPGNKSRFVVLFENHKCTLERQISYLNCYAKWDQFNQSSSDAFFLRNSKINCM